MNFRQLVAVAAILVLIAAACFIQAPAVKAFEDVTIYVTATSSTVTFTVHDPRALEHLQSASFVTTEDFETEVMPNWQHVEGGPGESWIVEVDPELAEILFRSDIPLLWDITGPWQQNDANNGIVRKPQLFTRLPFIANN